MSENNEKNTAETMKDAVKNIKGMSADEAKEKANQKLNEFKKLEPKQQAIYVGAAAVALFVLFSIFGSKSAYAYMDEYAEKKFECYEIKYHGKKLKDKDDVKDAQAEYKECKKEMQQLSLEMLAAAVNFDKEDIRAAEKEAKARYKSMVKELKSDS